MDHDSSEAEKSEKMEMDADTDYGNAPTNDGIEEIDFDATSSSDDHGGNWGQVGHSTAVAGTSSGATTQMQQQWVWADLDENWDTEIVDSDEEDDLAACFDSVTLNKPMKQPTAAAKTPIYCWDKLDEKMMRHIARREKLAKEKRSGPPAAAADALKKLQQKKIQRKKNHRYGEK